jgi:hypothetical protein
VTTRERASVVLTVLGALCVVVAAGVLGGWPVSLGTGGVLMVVGGVLLGLGDEPTVPVPPLEVAGPADDEPGEAFEPTPGELATRRQDRAAS